MSLPEESLQKQFAGLPDQCYKSLLPVSPSTGPVRD